MQSLQGAARESINKELTILDSIWENLFPGKQQRLVRMVIDRATIFTDRLDLTLSGEGVQAVVDLLVAEHSARGCRCGGRSRKPRTADQAADPPRHEPHCKQKSGNVELQVSLKRSDSNAFPPGCGDMDDAPVGGDAVTTRLSLIMMVFLFLAPACSSPSSNASNTGGDAAGTDAATDGVLDASPDIPVDIAGQELVDAAADGVVPCPADRGQLEQAEAEQMDGKTCDETVEHCGHFEYCDCTAWCDCVQGVWNCDWVCDNSCFGDTSDAADSVDTTCEPDCEGKDCGEDGCGGDCGTCDDADSCTDDSCGADGQCVFSDNGKCPIECPGPNPQGCISTGCPQGETCTQVPGLCVPSGCACDAGSGSWICTADCSGGTCVCQPDCEGKDCEDDGCGGSCGQCQEHFACEAGACVYQPWCGDGTCDVDLLEDCATCPGDCGCPEGQLCADGTCVEHGTLVLLAQDTPIAIPDNKPAGVTSSIVVGMSVPVLSATVSVQIQHSYVGALTIAVLHGGQSQVLKPVTSASSTEINESFLPTAFDGMDAAGEWTLQVADIDAYGDSGQLLSWSLEIQY
ncbi:MAG: hypothetical protein FJ109_11600 [Deltaproteobacteria bacterium]|nr:hypothetical protein [Deltaproteobacteria bacterium]